MEHIIRPLVLYALFLVLTSCILKYIHNKDSETAILEYKIDIYLNSIRQDIIEGYHKKEVSPLHVSPIRMEETPSPDLQEDFAVKKPTVRPYSKSFNQYYQINT